MQVFCHMGWVKVGPSTQQVDRMSATLVTFMYEYQIVACCCADPNLQLLTKIQDEGVY